MQEKIDKVIEKVEISDSIDAEKKSAIMIKLKEWREEDEAINDVAVRFENFWMELEPIFAEMGWI
jgi:tetrahydromethanopterin S-methyltransferase subunit A